MAKQIKYKGVSSNQKGGKNSGGTNEMYLGTYKGARSYHKTPESADKWVDLKLIADGKEPVNILKRK